MGAFDNVALTPCPPEYTDYEAKSPGTINGTDVPAAISLNNLYRTESAIGYGSLLTAFGMEAIGGCLQP